MDTLESATEDESPIETDVDVVVVGAGILGINELYELVDAGFSVKLLEAGDGVGGTWFWNRYPEARFDSESYTYAYLFSKELFEEWDWQEHFAGQPEIERYINYVVDKFDLRRHIQFGARVTSARWDEPSGAWTVRAADGTVVRARFLISATGVLSLPFYPAVPGREDFRGEAYHTGLWPKTPVDCVGKRVAVIGTGSSGVQIIPAIADEVASLTVYQRTANWAVPLNNRPITPEEQAELKANFEAMVETLNKSLGGFLHVPHDRTTFEDSEEERQAFYETMWKSPGFSKLSSNYTDMLLNPEANKEWCKFVEGKIRGIVKDPDTADKLIPDHKYAEKRPPFATDYYEAYNKPNVSLIDIRATPILRVTETGIETADGHQEFDIIVWATGFDFGTGSLNRMGIVGRNGLALKDHWADGPVTYLGVFTAGFPNFAFPGGPHGAAGNNPRYGGDQLSFVTEMLVYMREHGYDIVEVEQSAEDEWSAMVDAYATKGPFSEKSYFFGSNIPGKPRRYLLNPAGRPKLLELLDENRANEFKAFAMSRASESEAASTSAP